MQPRSILFIAVMVMAQLPPSPMFGPWRVNLDQSKFSGTPQYRRMTCRIEPWEEGLKVVYDIVGTRGGVTHLEWTGKLDGKDYAVQGLEIAVTNAYTPIDDRHYTVVVREDGRTTSTNSITISPDGKFMTVKSPTSVVVYQRQ